MLRRTSVVFLSLFFASVLLAQPLKPGEWRAYTSMRSIRAMALSPDSVHLWAATGGGVFRINVRDTEDPLAFRTTDGLSENDIVSVATDVSGNAYVGGNGGAFDLIHTDGTIEKLGADIRSRQDLTPKKILDIYLQGDTVFLATGYGLAIYRVSGRYFPSTAFQLGPTVQRQDSVRAVAVYHGYVFAAMRQGLAYASLKTDVSIPANWSLISDTTIGQIFSLEVFQNTLCVGASRGLFTYSESARSLLPTSFSGAVDRLSSGSTALYLLDLSHNVYSSSDLRTFTSVEAPNKDAATSSITAAPQGIGVAFGTVRNGIGYWLGTTRDTNIYPAGPVSSEVNDINFATSKHELFYISSTNGFGSFSPDSSRWKNYSDGSVLPAGTAFDRVFYDSVRDLLWLPTLNGKLYVAHNFGIDPLSVDEVKRIESGLPSISRDETNTYFRAGKPILDATGRLVITTWAGDGRGLSILDPGSSYHFTNYQVIDPTAVSWSCVTQDIEGNFWVGDYYNQSAPPSAGLSWHNMPDHTYGNIPGPPQGTQLLHNTVNALATDQDDEIWCGTSAGLQILSNPYAMRDQNPKFYFRSVKLLERQVVHSIATDGVGNKWIATEQGIFVVSPDGSDSVARFTKSNSPLIDDFIWAIAIDPELGEAYAATPSGISRFSTIFKQGEADYSKIRAYPNPVVQTTEQSPLVYIDGLMAGSTVKIFSMNMKLVKSINGTNLGSTVIWDGRDDIGHQVPSGEYLISATTTESGEHGAAKVVIVRK